MDHRRGAVAPRQGQGEWIAAWWLRLHGWSLIDSRVRTARGEVDLIAKRGKTLSFVEVKTRQEGTRIRPLDAVNKSKQALIERGANAWLKQLGTRDLPWRFDVIEIYAEDGEKPRVNHVKDAF